MTKEVVLPEKNGMKQWTDRLENAGFWVERWKKMKGMNSFGYGARLALTEGGLRSVAVNGVKQSTDLQRMQGCGWKD